MKEKLTKVIADNLFATTEQKELSAKKIWEIAEFIAPFVAEAAKEEFMKNAVLETEVLRDSDGDGVDTPYESWLTLANTDIPELPESLGFNDGDKVKILIVKSE